MRRLVVVLLLVAGGCFAQKAPAESMMAFWTRFQAAVAKSDAEAMASMTQLPFLLENKNLDKAGFVKAVPKLFPAKIRTCFAKEKLVKDKNGFEIFCGEQMFVFELAGGKYWFTTLGAND